MNLKILHLWPLLVTFAAVIVAASFDSEDKKGVNEESSEPEIITAVDIPLTFTTQQSGEVATPQESTDENTSNETVPNDETEEWTEILRKLFLKWGYTLDQIPEPFGTMKTGDVRLSPEFSIILQALEDTIPDHLRGQIETLVEQDGLLDRQENPSGEFSKLVEVKDTINGILDSNELAKVKSGSGNDGKKAIARTFTRFCAEASGACEEDDSNAYMGMTYEELLKLDKETLEKLLAELKSFLMMTPSDWNSNQVDKANYKLVKVIRLVHDIEAMTDKQLAALKEQQVSQVVVVQEIIEDTTPTPIATSISDGLATREVFIAQQMKEHENPVDVSIVGNSMKEVGRHMGKIVMDRANSHNEDSKAAENINIKIQVFPKTVEQAIVQKQPMEGVQILNLTSILSADEAHDSHKTRVMDLIRTLKITGKTEQDLERIKRIEQLVEEIDKEHHKAVELERKLHQLNMQRTRGGRRRFGKNYRRILQQRLESIENSSEQPDGDVIFEKQRRVLVKTHHLDAPVQPLGNPINDQVRNVITQQQQQHIDTSKNAMQVQVVAPPPVPIVAAHSVIADLPDSAWNGKSDHKVLVQSGKKTLVVDKLAAEPAEVNLNGGFEASIDNLKEQFPNGRWPDSDVWKKGESKRLAHKLESIVGPNPKLKSESGQYWDTNSYSGIPIHLIVDDYYNDDYNDLDNTMLEVGGSSGNAIKQVKLQVPPPPPPQQQSDLKVINLQQEFGPVPHGKETNAANDLLNPQYLEQIIREQQSSVNRKEGDKEHRHHVQEHDAKAKIK